MSSAAIFVWRLRFNTDIVYKRNVNELSNDVVRLFTHAWCVTVDLSAH